MVIRKSTVRTFAMAAIWGFLGGIPFFFERAGANIDRLIDVSQ